MHKTNISEEAILYLAASEGTWLQSVVLLEEPVRPPYTPLPNQVQAMVEACNFITVLAMAAKRWQAKKSLVDRANGDKSLSYSQTNSLIKAIKGTVSPDYKCLE